MKKSEVAQLLVFKHSIEGGEPVEAEVEAWYSVIGHLDYTDALAAAQGHYRVERRLLPADLITACEEPERLSSWAGNVTEQRLAAEAAGLRPALGPGHV